MIYANCRHNTRISGTSAKSFFIAGATGAVTVAQLPLSPAQSICCNAVNIFYIIMLLIIAILIVYI